jgi:hypothetical protein
MSSFLDASAMVTPWLRRTSASRSLPMICSGLNAFFTISFALFVLASLTQQLVPF